MKIENLDRAKAAQEELAALDLAIAEFDKIKENTGFMLTEFHGSFGDGFRVARQYKNGNYHPMYQEILAFTLDKFTQARLDLLQEISEL